MGQAKLRRAALETAIPPLETQQRVHDAVMKTLTALDFPGVNDCLYHASATAGALRAFGLSAELEVGAAWWAVGPDGADTICHGFDAAGKMVADQYRAAVKGLVHVHSWAAYSVHGVRYVVDMTTYQIPEKARLMSEADGLPLRVTIPVAPFYWGRMPPQKAMTDAKPGEWSYWPVPNLARSFMENKTVQMVGDVAAISFMSPAMTLVGVD